MPFTYRDVSDLYRTLKDAGVVSEDLPSWSSEMNRLSNSNLYDQGLNDNFIKQGSTAIDRAIDWTGLPKVTRPIGEAAGSLVGNPQAGAQIGEGLPRMLANFLPVTAAAVAAPEATIPALLGYAATGGLSGAETYTNTGSPAAGLVSGATNALMPGAAGLTERLAGGGVKGFLAGQLGAAAMGEGSSVLQSVVDPNQQYHFSPTSTLLNMTLGQLPFAAAHLAGKVFGRGGTPSVDDLQQAASVGQGATSEQQLRQQTPQSPLEKVPDVTVNEDPVAQAKISSLLAELRGEHSALVAKGSPDDLDRIDELANRQYDLMGQSDGTGVMGEKVAPESDRFNVAGTEHYYDPTSGYRIVKLNGDPANTQQGFNEGQLIGYSTAYEPVPEPLAQREGVNKYSIPTRFHNPDVVDNRAPTDAAAIQANPDLPLQPESGLDQMRERAADYSDARAKLDGVQMGDDEGFRKAVESVNGTRLKWGDAPLTDASIEAERQRIGALDPVAAVKGVVNTEIAKSAQREELLRKKQTDQQDADQNLGTLLEQEQTSGGTDLADMYKAVEGGRPGLFSRVVQKWTQDGKPGGIDGLRARALKAKQDGGLGVEKVKAKVEPVVEKTTEAAKAVTPDTDPMRNLRESVARTVTEGEEDEQLANEFAHAFADGSIDSPELKDFREQPNVARWIDEANGELGRLGQHRTLGGGAGDATPFLPQTDAEHAALANFAPDSGGESIIRQVLANGDPTEKALAQDLLEGFPASLKRVAVRIMQMSQEGLARNIGDRQVEVQLSHGILLSQDHVRRNQVLLHELLHGLTLAELDEPTQAGAVEKLEALRQELIKRLPQRVQDHLQGLIKSDWITRFASGEDPEQAELYGKDNEHKPWAQVLYGLMNNKELVSQGFTNPRMKQFLQSVKVPGSKINAFYNWVKNLFGLGQKVTDNAFARFADVTSQILDRGNWVSDFNNFTDQYFGAKGLSPGNIRDLSQKALQVVQSASPIAHKDVMLSVLANGEPMTAQFLRAKAALGEMLQTNGPDADQHRAIFGELDHAGDGPDGLLVDHLQSPNPDMDTAMQMLPQPTLDYMFQRAHDMQNALDGVRAATNGKNEGLVNIADPSALRKPVADALKALGSFLQYEKENAQSRATLAPVGGVAPDSYFNRQAATPSRALPAPTEVEDAVGDANGIVKGSALWKWLAPMAQLARSDPRLGEYYSRLILMPAKIRQMVSASTKVFSRDMDANGNLGKENSAKVLDTMYKALESGPLKTAINKLLFKKQELGGNAVRQLDYNSPEVREIMSKLNPVEQKQLVEFDNKSRLAKVAADQQSLDAFKQVLAMRAARLPMADEGMKLSPALDASGQLFDALNSNFQDPQQAAQANAQIAAVQSKMQPQSFLNLLQYTKDSVQQHQELTQHLGNNPDWVSAKRNGDFLFDYVKNGKVVASSANNLKEAIAEAGGKDKVLNWKPNQKDPDSYFDFGNATPDMVQRMRELEQNQIQAMQNRGASPEVIAAMQRMSIASQVEREANVAGRGNPLILKGRTLSRGAEELPWFENHIDWFSRNSNYWQRRLMRETSESLASEPGTAGTDAADMIRQHMQQFMQKDPEVGRAIQKIASTWSLGFSLAGNIANATQTWMRGVTELIGLGGGTLGSFRDMADSWKDLTGKKLENAPLRPGEDKFLADAKKDGQLDPTMRDEEASADELSSVRFKQVLNKDKPQSMGQYATKAAGAYTNAGMWLWKQGDYMNNKAQLLATWRTLQRTHPELSYEDAKKQAYLVNAAVNDVGGRANRPIGPFAGKDQVSQTLAMTMMSLRSYTLGSTMQLIRQLKAGAFRPNGLTPAEVFAARKAAIYQLGVQFAAAGTLGMPFVAGASALLNQFFPELEVQKKLRESVSSLFGSDTENGHILSDIALSGVPSMMGWDFASRLNAGNMLPGVSEYDGFQPEALLGQPANIVGNFVRGAKDLASGNAAGGYAFVPPAIKKITQLVANGGTATDYRGRPILSQPLTLGEKVGVVAGFQPTRTRDYNVADRLAQQEQTLAKQRSGQETQQLAEQALKGNFGTVRAGIQAQQSSDKSYNPVDGVKGIARAAEEMTFPKDLRREGSRTDMDSRKQLLSSFSLDPSATSEVARFQFRTALQQRLGLMAVDKDELVKAQLMDQLRQSDPTATRSALSAAATAALRRSQPSTLVNQ